MAVNFIITTRLSMPVVLVALAVVSIIGSSLTVVIWVLGLLIWGDVPRHNVFLGAALIFAAGVTIILGERFGRRAI